MIPIAIKIGDAVSLSNPANEQITPDDRRQKIEIIGGVVVQDYGHIAAGDTTSWELEFNASNWSKIVDYWDNGTMVQVTDAGGEVFTARVIVKSYLRIPKFPGYHRAQIELWRV